VDLGWLEGVHPDDRASAVDIRRQAFTERKTYSVVYRIRCADGMYRWLVERGIPRPDGTFRGYASLLDKGLIDTAEHHHAERMLRDLTGRVINAQEDERRRIARELHDNVNQQIALLSIEIEQLGLRPPESSSAVTARMKELAARTAHISSEIHNLSHRLHSSQLDALGLVAAVRAQCLEFASQGVDVDFVDKDVRANVPENVALSLFRILQEGLTNVAKHSGASHARVTLIGTGGAIVLRVIDAGRGFDPADVRTPGLGLVSMRERLRMLDGVLTITSQPGHGTTIEARVPYAPASGRAGDSRRSDLEPT
jgi:signal transduction histidine kinase